MSNEIDFPAIMTRNDEDGDLQGTVPNDEKAMSKETDELADALFDSAPERHDHMAIVAYRTQLRKLARDSAKVGAVKALQEAEEQLVRQDSFSERTLRIIDEVAATYTEQGASRGTE